MTCHSLQWSTVRDSAADSDSTRIMSLRSSSQRLANSVSYIIALCLLPCAPALARTPRLSHEPPFAYDGLVLSSESGIRIVAAVWHRGCARGYAKVYTPEGAVQGRLMARDDFFFFNDATPPKIYPFPLHDALPN